VFFVSGPLEQQHRKDSLVLFLRSFLETTCGSVWGIYSTPLDHLDWLPLFCIHACLFPAHRYTTFGMASSRILIREVTANGIIQATLVTDEFVFSNSVDAVRLKNKVEFKIEYFLGIINSKLISFYHLNTSANAFKGTFPKLLIKDILNFPAPNLQLVSKEGRGIHDKMVSLVGACLNLSLRLQTTYLEHEKRMTIRQIESIEKQIDRLVYELFGLTEEEINMVEGKLQGEQ
jgi:TaqI-like C-terminal specificity domain